MTAGQVLAFSDTASLITARANHTATLLPSGLVLVSGGNGNWGKFELRSAILYDPATANWTETGSLPAARSHDTATLLLNGRVLVAGSLLNETDLYDPATKSWTASGRLAGAREAHTATLLPNAEVLVAGGHGWPVHGLGSLPLDSAELYNPAGGTWTTTGSLAIPREYHTATLLPNGLVLVAGGRGGFNGSILASAELYDPATATWKLTGKLAVARENHTATLLPNGQVLVAGGMGNAAVGEANVLDSAELYDPVSGTWTVTGRLGNGRVLQTATLLPDGRVLVCAGLKASNFVGPSATAELYDPASGTWSGAGSLSHARFLHTATSLADGRVLVAGGQNAIELSVASAEIYGDALPPATFGNISTRSRVGIGDNVLIGGFMITGTQPKKVLLRAIGPSLSVPGALVDPVLELHGPTGATITTNDNWKESPDRQAIIESTIPPSDDAEAAVIAALDPGAYTAIVKGKKNGTGVALVEIYDLDQTVDGILGNISTRALVKTGDDVLIGGFIVHGTQPLSTLLRAIGPSLPVANALGDPVLELHDSEGSIVAANDNWRSDQEAAIEATTIPPTNDAESAILVTLVPGNYTAVVTGKDNSTGVALVEVYQVGN